MPTASTTTPPTGRPVGRLAAQWRKLTRSRAELDADEAAREAEQHHATLLGSAAIGTVITAHGRITQITRPAAGSAPQLIVRISDGTAEADLTFTGRRSIPGIDPGRHITVTGRIVAPNGTRVIYNPRYLLAPGHH